jgi:hypothetical protein
VSGRQRVVVGALVLLAVLSVVVLLAFAGRACPVDTPERPCPAVATNRAVVLSLAGVSVALLVTPFAFLAEFVARRRIVYRGAWWRAARRGVLAGLVLVALGALRLGEALTVPAGIFIVLLGIAVERFLAMRDVR